MVVRVGAVPRLTLQPVLGHVDLALVEPPVAPDAGGGDQVVPHVRQSRPGAGGVARGGREARQGGAVRESEVTPGPDGHPLLSLSEQVGPLGVAEHLLDGHTVLVTQRQSRRLPVLDAAVGEGVVTEHGLGCRPARLRQLVDELLLDSRGDLLVPPAPGIVLADVEPDQAAAQDEVPADGPVVGSAVTSHLPALLARARPLLPLHVDHEAPLVMRSVGGQLVHGLAGEVPALLRLHPQHRAGVEGEGGPLHSLHDLRHEESIRTS